MTLRATWSVDILPQEEVRSHGEPIPRVQQNRPREFEAEIEWFVLLLVIGRGID